MFCLPEFSVPQQYEDCSHQRSVSARASTTTSRKTTTEDEKPMTKLSKGVADLNLDFDSPNEYGSESSQFSTNTETGTYTDTDEDTEDQENTEVGSKFTFLFFATFYPKIMRLKVMKYFLCYKALYIVVIWFHVPPIRLSLCEYYESPLHHLIDSYNIDDLESKKMIEGFAPSQFQRKYSFECLIMLFCFPCMLILIDVFHIHRINSLSTYQLWYFLNISILYAHETHTHSHTQTYTHTLILILICLQM